MTASDPMPRRPARELPQILNDVLLNYVHDSVTITDGQGILLNVSASCEENFGFAAKDFIGKPIELLERKGIFRPCITLMVLEQGRKVTSRQPYADAGRVQCGGANPSMSIRSRAPTGAIRSSIL